MLSQFGPEFLLYDRAARSEILLALRVDDASRFARLLSFESASDPFGPSTRLIFAGTHPFRVFVAFFGVTQPEEETQELPAAREVVRPAYPLFDHQRTTRTGGLSPSDRLRPPRVLLHMPTGAGKTRTAMHVISLFLRHQALDEEVVIWLAHTEELCEQAAEEFSTAWQQHRRPARRAVPPLRATPGRSRQHRGGFVVAGLQKLYRDSLPRQGEFIQFGPAVASGGDGRGPFGDCADLPAPAEPTHRHSGNGNRHPRAFRDSRPGRAVTRRIPAGSRSFSPGTRLRSKCRDFVSPVDYLQQQGYLARADYIPLRPPAEAGVEVSAAEDSRSGKASISPSRSSSGSNRTTAGTC